MTRHISTDRKSEAVFNALSEHGPLSFEQLVARTGLSGSQVRGGWKEVRRMFGVQAVMNHRGGLGATFALSDDIAEGKRYELWQARNVLTRMRSLLATIEQGAGIVTDVSAVAQYYAARAGMVDAMAPMRARVRAIGSELGFAVEEIEAWVADQSLNGAAAS